MKQNEKTIENISEEVPAKAALKDALLEEKDADKVSGGVYAVPMPDVPPQEIP